MPVAEIRTVSEALEVPPRCLPVLSVLQAPGLVPAVNWPWAFLFTVMVKLVAASVKSVDAVGLKVAVMVVLPAVRIVTVWPAIVATAGVPDT